MQVDKVCAAFALVAIFACVADAAIYSQPAIFHPAHPGKCYDKFTRKALLPDKEYKPKGICASMTCSLEAREISIETCPYVEAPGCEELPSDPNWSFPKCCPQFKCVDFKTGKEFIVSL
ncbi:hypothetical protein KR018_012238 [Drosophila ironensis]|nr:hypothetical protein KR018_012238 [Drosophila ironensis]